MVLVRVETCKVNKYSYMSVVISSYYKQLTKRYFQETMHEMMCPVDFLNLKPLTLIAQ